MTKKKTIKLSIPLSKDQEEKILEMFEYYLPELIEEDSTFPYFGDFGIVHYTSKDDIHWYELLSNILVKEVFKSKSYWQNRYVVQCIELYFPTCLHPVDWVFEKHEKSINNIPLFRTSEEQLEDIMKATKKLKKDEKPEKQSKKEVEKKTKKEKIKEDEFFQ